MRAVIVLLCGIPGAGKTTVARKLVAQHGVEAESATPGSFAERVVVERISFDELYERNATVTTVFDPAQWKRMQHEMTTLVRERLSQFRSSADGARLVLLVDDNFYYRSMRKRFYHIAEEDDCGFGIIYVATPHEICRMRNDARDGPARVPLEQFEKMLRTFESPDVSFNFESDLVVLGDTDNGSARRSSSVDTNKRCSDPTEALSLVLNEAARKFEAKRCAQVTYQARLLQQSEDQKRTAENAAHSFDLASRKWVSLVLKGDDAAFAITSTSQKALLAKTLNHRRKLLLSKMKAKISLSGTQLPRPDQDPLEFLEHFRADMIRELSAA